MILDAGEPNLKIPSKGDPMNSRNYHLAFLPVLLVLLAACQAVQQTEDTPKLTVIEGATVIDGVADAPIEDAILVIEGDTIRSLGKRGTFQPPVDAVRIDATGKTIMPGIIDLHTHVGRAQGMERDAKYYNRARVLRDANIILYYGVTHAISLGTDLEPIFQFLADQRAGKVGGTRLYSAGVGISAKGGVIPPVGILYFNTPTTAEEARQIVQQEAAKPVDYIKIYVADRGPRGGVSKLTPEIYGAVIDEAHKHNLKVISHQITLEDAKELIRQGVDALGHSVRDQEVDEEFLQLAKESGVVQLPTLAGHRIRIDFIDQASYLDDPGVPLLFPASVLETVTSKQYRDRLVQTRDMAGERRDYEMAVRNTAKVAAAGITIAMGSDSSGAAHFQGLWAHRELELWVEAGLTPIEAIRAATVNGAKFLGIDDRYGTLAPGMVADFIVLNGDPLADMANSRKIDAVWMNGEPVDRAALASASIP